MIVSRGRRYIFVHIPKTGGTAMTLALEDRAMADDVIVSDTPKGRKRRGRLKGVQTSGRLWKHSSLAEAEGLITPRDLEDSFVFTLVRNPWDRVVSYYHWLRDQSFDHPAVRLAQALEFSAFLNHVQTATSLRAHPYDWYLTDGAGRVHCDSYIRLEHLQGDLGPLSEHLGFSPDLPRANASRRDADYRRYYSDADAAMLARLCQPDIDRFGYAF